MEAVAANAALPDIFWKRKARRTLRERAVKGGVEAGELRGIGEQALGFADEFEFNRYVQWSKMGGGLAQQELSALFSGAR